MVDDDDDFEDEIEFKKIQTLIDYCPVIQKICPIQKIHLIVYHHHHTIMIIMIIMIIIMACLDLGRLHWVF